MKRHSFLFILRRRGLLSTLALVLALVLPMVVLADDISNNLDTSIDAVAEVMPLVLGGPSGSTQFYVTPRNDDGKNGCNLTGGTTLVVSVNSSDLSVATVGPTSLTFGSCGDQLTVTVTPAGVGSASISLAQTSNSTAGTFNLAPATFTVNVTPPPNTAPTVFVAGVTGGESYEIGSVPAATCQVVDAEDGNSSFPATLSSISGPLASYGLGTQTASCSYTDGGGLTAVASETYGIVDTVAPVITLISRTLANANGWNNGDVDVSWSCSDSGSGVVSANINETVSSEGASQTVTGTCEDHAGNSSSDTQVDINIDKTAPVISGAALPGANSHGWNNSDVTVSFICSDALSGIEACTAAQILAGEGADQSATGSATDKAGNTSSVTVGNINIDKTAPTASASASPAPNGNGWNNTPVTVSFTGLDSLSGIDSCSAPVSLSSEGTDLSASGTCTDKAGNESTAATASGIDIDMTAPINISFAGGPVNGGVYYFGYVPAGPTGCTADGAISGLASCTVSGYSSAVGIHTITATATDNAGNTGNAALVYTVNAWTLTGFYNPVTMGFNVWNTVKGGSTVPLKFEMFAGATELTDTSAISSFSTRSVSCSTATAEDAVDFVTTGGTSLRYDATAGQFVQNWQTPKQAGKCFEVTMLAKDGSKLVAFFKLK